jgi:hypothetical protein
MLNFQLLLLSKVVFVGTMDVATGLLYAEAVNLTACI